MHRNLNIRGELDSDNETAYEGDAYSSYPEQDHEYAFEAQVIPIPLSGLMGSIINSLEG